MVMRTWYGVMVYINLGSDIFWKLSYYLFIFFYNDDDDDGKRRFYM